MINPVIGSGSLAKELGNEPRFPLCFLVRPDLGILEPSASAQCCQPFPRLPLWDDLWRFATWLRERLCGVRVERRYEVVEGHAGS